MHENRLEELFAKYYHQKAMPAEVDELMALVRDADPGRLGDLVQQHGAALEELAPVIPKEEAMRMLDNIMGQQAPRPRRFTLPKAAAAAALAGLLAATAAWLLRPGSDSTPAPVPPQTAQADIAPARQKAMLLLDNEQAIGLDTLANGPVHHHGASAATHANGQLVYAAGPTDGAPVYNTIATGKGNYFKLTLSDGTLVWLNAASSIRFPVAFSGSERNVEVRGEAYFEVAKDAARPFFVKTGGDSRVEVLGTHFNVNAYTENNEVRTTLVQGAVKVVQGKAAQLLKPGQQAVSGNAGNIRLVANADMARVLAWKEGYFLFEDNGIREIMSEAARWYDIDVRYEGNVTEEGFSGRISREASLSKLLQILELNGLSITVKGKTITIK